MSYVELHARSAFSFLRGASLPEQLAEHAAQLHMPAMALCDRDGVYGAPRFFAAAREQGIRAIIGSELTMEDGTILPVLVETRVGYHNLCRLLTRAHLRAPKSESAVRWDELAALAEGLLALTGDEEGPLYRSLSQNLRTPPDYVAADVRKRMSEGEAQSASLCRRLQAREARRQTSSPAQVLEKLIKVFA